MSCWCKGQCPVIRRFQDLSRKGDARAAEAHLKTALIDAPACPEANLALAKIYADSNRACFGWEHVRAATETEKTGSPLASQINLAAGKVARSAVELDQAIADFDQGLKVSPGDTEIWCNLMDALQAKGDTERGMAVMLDAREKFPDNVEIRRSSASMMAATKNFAGAERMITGSNMRPLDYLDRGRYRDRQGEAGGAWEDWTRAKELLREKANFYFQQDAFDKMMLDLTLLATKKRQKQIPGCWPRPAGDGPQPVFVLGFPRSGTTMTETAISAHSEIMAGDELPFANELVQIMPGMLGTETPYPFALVATGLSENVTAMGLFRDWYLRRAQFRLAPLGWPEGTKFFTDKMCLNEIHIPFLLRMFPESPIFVVRRHPLDVVVSNWSYFIRHGWQYGSTLWSTAHVLTRVDALVERYAKLFPGKIHFVRYEDFVADPKPVLQSMFKARGLSQLKWEGRVVDFHENPRHSRTISHRQIKEPAHDRSVGRWKAYREKFPPQLIEAVRAICERESYEI